MTKPKKTLWLLHLAGGVEASIHGPYKTEEAREAGLLDIELDPMCDSLMNLDIDAKGVPDVCTFSMEELDTVSEAREDRMEEEDMENQ